MNKIKIETEDLKDILLSPGDIYWKKRSGDEVLISKKEDILNIEMIQKLSLSNQILVMENGDDYSIDRDFEKIFTLYKEEIIVREKFKWKNEFTILLLKHFYQTSRSQFELSRLCWKLFSTIDREVGKQYLDRDCDYFKRALNVSASYVICAYLVGYYDDKFLRKIYSTTVTTLMEIGKENSIVSLKHELEELWKKKSLSLKDLKYIETLIDFKSIEQTIFFEKQDGTGPMRINIHEMNDLEKILTTLNSYYEFKNIHNDNILSELSKNNERFNIKIFNQIKRNFDKLINNFEEQFTA